MSEHNTIRPISHELLDIVKSRLASIVEAEGMLDDEDWGAIEDGIVRVLASVRATRITMDDKSSAHLNDEGRQRITKARTAQLIVRLKKTLSEE